MAIAVFLEDKESKKKDYKFYDYFSTKQGIHNVDFKPKDGFEVIEVKMATGRHSISELLNQCISFKQKK